MKNFSFKLMKKQFINNEKLIKVKLVFHSFSNSLFQINVSIKSFLIQNQFLMLLFHCLFKMKKILMTFMILLNALI